MRIIRNEELARINAEKGGLFFSPDNMAYLGSRVESFAKKLGGEAHFITSERWTEDGVRRIGYTLRAMSLETGNVRNVSDFCEYESLRDAVVAQWNYMVLDGPGGGDEDQASECH